MLNSIHQITFAMVKEKEAQVISHVVYKGLVFLSNFFHCNT